METCVTKLRVRDYALRHGIHRTTVYSWVRRGLIPGARKVGGSILIPDDPPSKLEAIERKVDELLHEVRKGNRNNGQQNY